MQIRAMRDADAAGVARVYVETWQSAYRGLLPDAVLDAMDIDRDTRRWQRDIARQPLLETGCVAESAAGVIVGLITAGPERRAESGEAGEIYRLYVLPEAQGLGIGKALVARVFKVLIAGGAVRIRVGVLSDNRAGRRFYERLGAVPDRARPFELGGQRLFETLYEWPEPATVFSRFDRSDQAPR